MNLEIDWEAPSSCPGGASVRQAVLTRLDEDTVRERPAVQLHGRVRRVGEAWVLALRVQSGSRVERRELTGSDCETLVRAAALVTAVAVEGEAATPALERAPGAEATTAVAWVEPPPDAAAQTNDGARSKDAPVAPAEPDPQPTVAPPATSSTPWTWSVAARVGASLGVLPRPGVDLEVAGGVSRRLFRAELTVRYAPPRPARYDDRPDVGGDVGLWALGASACVQPGAGRWAFPLCLAGHFGGVHSRGVGFVDNRRDHVPWGAASLRAGLAPTITRWLALTAHVEGTVAFVQPEFAPVGQPVVFRAGRFGARALAGAEFRLPNRRKRR